MKYTIEEAKRGGWVVTKHLDFSSEIESVGTSLEDAVAPLAGIDNKPQLSIAEAARNIVACTRDLKDAPKINMIKLHRAITNCGLKESKDAIEAAIRAAERAASIW